MNWNSRPRRIRNIALIWMLPLILCSQLLDSDQNPPGIDWKYIRSDHFVIIFPGELDADAQRVANTLEFYRNPLNESLDGRMHHWPIVLSNRSTTPRGYVTLGPRRSEWYGTPTQGSLLGTDEWYHMLAIHEGRHMAQYDKLSSGFTGLAGYLFGEYGLSVMSSFSVPMWFWEGDAVVMETLLTNGGRGRMPIFDMDIRTLLLSDIRYGYHKAYQGSLRDWYPNHYPLGYLMVTHVSRKYGYAAWNDILQRSARFSFWPFGFSGSVKKYTGRNVREIYNDSMNELDSLWRIQLSGTEISAAQPLIDRQAPAWTLYRYPQALDDGTVIAEKVSLADPNWLVKILPNGCEVKIRQIAPKGRFSAAQGRAVWAEYTPDRRWGRQSFSNVVIYDLPSGKRRMITQDGKYFMPALAPDGERVAAVEFTPDRTCTLVLLDSETGDITRRFANPENDFIQAPSWSENGERIVFTRQKYHGKALGVIDIESGKQIDILPESEEDVTWPVFWGAYILYNSPLSGIDNIYAVEIESGQRYQVTSRKFGAFYPSVSNGGSELLFSDYNRDGLSVQRMSLNPSEWRCVALSGAGGLCYFEPLSGQFDLGPVQAPDALPVKNYPVMDYRRFLNHRKVHSWWVAPLLPDVKAGFVSTDLLNTSELRLSTTYNVNEKVQSVAAVASIAVWEPILDIGFQFGQRAAQYQRSGGGTAWDSWVENAVSLGIRLPFDISRDIYATVAELGFGFSYTDIRGKRIDEQYRSGNGSFVPFYFRVNYQRYRQRSKRDIYPVWGEEFQLAQHVTLPGSDYRGRLFSTQGRLFLPGFWRHHSLRFEGAYENQVPQNYQFRSELQFVRGYDYVYADDFYRAGILYEFPLAYPDLALGSLAYIKRLRAMFFYEYGQGRSEETVRLFRSVGAELIIDYHLLTLAFIDLQSGLRFSYRTELRDPRLELLIMGIAF